MSNIGNQQVLEALRKSFDADVLAASEPYGLLTLEVNPSRIIEVLEFLNKHTELQLNFLTDLCAVHYPEDAGREIAVVYHLHSMVHNIRLRLKAFLPIEKPEIASATAIYSAANWMERETYDFYGVKFLNHPDLRRILNMDSMDYFPLRKEYALEDETRNDKDDRFFGR
jgi:NADH-quinone oxidoreductase subunit C